MKCNNFTLGDSEIWKQSTMYKEKYGCHYRERIRISDEILKITTAYLFTPIRKHK